MKTGRISAITAAGVMAAGALTVFAGTGTASAAGPTNLCSDSTTGFGTQCIDSEQGVGQWIITLPHGTASLTNWNYPTGTSPAPIQQADNVNFCLQVDETGSESSPANFEVIGAKCVNDAAEEWLNHYDATAKRTLFESVWALDNVDETLCLTYGPGDDDPAGLFVVPCEFSGNTNYWYQQWGTS
jgi:hypothetical protein